MFKCLFSLRQHRKEKGSQDLDFLEKVDDEMNKGESYLAAVCVLCKCTVLYDGSQKSNLHILKFHLS